MILALFAFPANSLAQEPVPTPTAGIEEEAPGVGDEDVDDPVDDEDPVEGDDAYTCGDEVGTDGDYVYCAAAGAGPPETPKRKDRPEVAAAQPLAAGALPYTGAPVGLVAGLGVALLLTGTGLRMIASSSSAVRSRSSVSWR